MFRILSLFAMMTMAYSSFAGPMADRAARDQEIENSLRRARVAQSHAALLRGLRAGPSGLNYSSAKCSDGWQSSDFYNQVDQLCDGGGCVPVYARDPRSYDGFIFTCNFYLNNGTECHAEGGGTGYGVFCTTPKPALKQIKWLIGTSSSPKKHRKHK